VSSLGLCRNRQCTVRLEPTIFWNGWNIVFGLDLLHTKNGIRVAPRKSQGIVFGILGIGGNAFFLLKSFWFTWNRLVYNGTVFLLMNN